MRANLSALRYPGERSTLVGTLLLVGVILLISAAPTLLLLPLAVGLTLAFSYSRTREHHQQLLRNALAVTPASAAGVDALVQDCRGRLSAEPVQVFAVRSRQLNAYTFGLHAPRVVVL